MKYFLLLIFSFILSFVLGFTIVPQLQEIEILTTCLTVFSICLALFCFIIPKWEVLRDKLLDSDECFREITSDNIERYKTILSNFEQLKDIAPKLVQSSQEEFKRLLKNEMVKMNKCSNIHKEAENPILGYQQLITISIILLVIHFVLNVIFIPSKVFVDFVKTEITFIDTDSLIWIVKRLSSSVKILNIAVQFLFLYKIAEDMTYFTLCLRSKEHIEKLDIKRQRKTESST